MKSIVSTLLLITTISIYAQDTPRITQALATLEAYNDKVNRAIQDVITCLRTHGPCTYQNIKQTRILNGILGAALKTVELEMNPMPFKTKPSKKGR